MELRQLRYFVTLAEELHFGRAAAREHIVQSALSQQIKRLEREVGQRLLERTTHHVRLTPAGHMFLAEARQILEHVERAAAATRRMREDPVLRAGAGHAGYGSMASILDRVRRLEPRMTIHEVEAGTPELVSALAGGRLDVGIGHVVAVPAGISAEMVRRERTGVLLPAGHPLTQRGRVPVAELCDERLLLVDDRYAPEFNRFVAGLFRAAGRAPTAFGGTVQSLRAAVDLVFHGHCVAIVPGSCPAHVGVEWRPLVEPTADYPWSVLWRTGERSDAVQAFLTAARMLARDREWQDSPTAVAEQRGHHR